VVVGGSGGNVVVGGSGGNHGVCLEEERRQPTNRCQPQDSSYIININNTIMYTWICSCSNRVVIRLVSVG